NRTTQAEKEPRAILQNEVPADGLVRAFLRLISLNCQFCTNLNGELGNAQADQGIGAAPFDHPLGDLSIGALNIKVEPGMGIDHVPLLHGALERYRLVDIKLLGKRMMRQRSRYGGQQGEAGYDNGKL